MKNIGINLSSLNYYVAKSKNKTEIIKEFAKIAAYENLDGIEFYPSTFLQKKDKHKLNLICKDISSLGLFYILDCNRIFDIDAIKDLITHVKLSKRKTLVILLSKILECKRHLIKKDWDEYINDSIKFLNILEPIAKDNGVKIAIENHQDFDSNDFLKILERFTKNNVIGLNFDIGNAFAVCEDPMVFCKKLDYMINNVHIKDYEIYETKEGFKLCSCSIGYGSVNIKPILKHIEKINPGITKTIEPGQLSPRHIMKNKKIFWKKIGARLVDEKNQFEKVLTKSFIRDKKYQNILLNKNDKEVFCYLKNQIKESIDFCKQKL